MRMLFRHERSIMSLSEKEIRVRMYYTYMIISSIESNLLTSEFLNIFLCLARALKKKSRMEYVLSERVRFMSPESVSSDYIIQELITLQREKDEESANRIGFNI